MNSQTSPHRMPKSGTIYLILLLSIIITYATEASAYRMTARELPTQQLLPVSPIHRLIQDSDGFFWYATEGGGLCRDDAYNIVVFRSPFPQFSSRFQVISVDSISSNHITCLNEGKVKRHIWFGTHKGLYYIDKSDYQVHTIEHPLLRTNNIMHLCAASDGSVWVNVPGWILRLDPDGKPLEKHPSIHNGIDLNINGLYQDSQHNLYATCNENIILRYDTAGKRFLKANWTYTYIPTRMTEDSRYGSYYVGTWGGGVAYYDSTTRTTTPCRYVMPPGEFGKQVLDVLFDNKKMILWVVTMEDFYAYQADRGNLKPISLEHVLPPGHKVLDRIYTDRDGNIWVPGYTPHTFIISMEHDNMVRYPVDATRRHTGFPVMADVVVNDGEYFWIWLGRDNISLYHPTTDRLIYGHNAGIPTIEKCLEKCQDDEGVWAATGNKLLHLTHDGMLIKTRTVAEIPANRITTLREANNRLWIGTDKAIYEIPVTGGKPRIVCDNTGWAHKLAIDTRDNIYAATATGLIHISPDGKKEWLVTDEDCSDVSLANDGKLWIASYEGNVYCYDTRLRKLTKENEAFLLGGESIKGIETDDSGHIWIITDQYTKEYNPTNKAVRVFHSTDENMGMDYMHSVRKMSDNRMCIGGMGAFCVIPSSHELDNLSSSPTVPVITSVTSGQRYILPGTANQTIELNPDEGECKVTFSTLDHLHTSQVSYAYRLESLQEEWTYLPQGSNTAYLNRLPVGSYRLLVKATNRYGNWSEPLQTITLQQLPAWYQTWWAYILYIILGVALILGVTWGYRRTRQILELHRRRNEVALSSVNINIDEKSMPKFDKDFLEKAVGLVERNIEDSEYNVERLSSDICMSRMSLYRKIHDQTGQTPSEFIRDIRLKRAASLLAKSDITIKEVALSVGFTTPSYFSKCFREKFGMLPAQYQKTHGRATTKTDS